MGDETREMYRDSRLRALGLAAASERETQAKHLASVSSRIGAAIIAFCKAHEGKTFHADDLRRAVTAATGLTAPGSADRVMRDLRAKGEIRYELINRRQSLYRIPMGGQ